MKLITWNCQGAFRNKIGRIAKYSPDIAVIQECETVERLGCKKWVAEPNEVLWFGDLPMKGIGIFSFGNYHLQIAECYDPSIKYCIPILVTGPQSFHLIAVWAMPNANR